MNILFRADSSSTIGTGHIMRDLVLAKQYLNDKILFAAQDLNGNINHKISEAGYEIHTLDSTDVEELDKLIKTLNIDLLVIDHYGIDAKQEKQLKTENSTLKILSFDDTYEKHHCDILLNHNISADKKKYKGLVPKDCELRCGSKYTLLRDEFIKEKQRVEKKRTNYSSNIIIFLAMGGADHSNKNIKILKVLKRFKNLKVNLVTTNANKNLKELKNYSKNKKWINLYINSNKIAKLMIESNFAIVTPSVTVNEVYFLGIPMITIKTADNQIDMYKYLKTKNFLVLKEFNQKKLEKSLFRMIKKIKGNK